MLFLCFLMHSLGHCTNITPSCFKFVSLQNFSFIQELKAKSKTSSQISPRQNPSSIFICQSEIQKCSLCLLNHYLNYKTEQAFNTSLQKFTICNNLWYRRHISVNMVGLSFLSWTETSLIYLQPESLVTYLMCKKYV